MDITQARKLSKIITTYSSTSYSNVVETLIPEKPLSGFHQWADGKPFEGGFLVTSSIGENFWLLIIEWNSSNGFYVVLFPEDKSCPAAEIHKIINDDTLNWRYSPIKQDGKNDLRKAYFEKYFLNLDVLISVPSSLNDVTDFLNECGGLLVNRLKADKLDDDTPEYREGFPEGKLKEKLHLTRERNSRLIKEVKKEALEKHGKLACECCGFDYASTYSELGHEFIEAHHLVPVSDLHCDGDETKKEDIALVCANCHRMLHRRRPWLCMGELKNIINKE